MDTPYSKARRYPRIPSEHPVMVEKLTGQEAELFSKTQIVGLGGCMFVSQERLGTDALLKMFISIRGQVIETKARVAWERPQDDGTFHVGVEFLEVPPADRVFLLKLLESKEP